MRLAWVSAPPWAPTGYGKVTRNFITRMKYPEEISCVATGGLTSGPYVEWNDIKVYPGKSYDVAGGDRRIAHLDKLLKKIDATHWVFHGDAWAYRNTIKDVGNKYPCITYSPIDGGHISAEEKEAIQVAQERIGMCRYADREIRKAGLSCTYIPHGVDTNVYKPMSQDEWREKVNLPKDAFIMGFFGTNISKRKGQAEMMMGMKKALDLGKQFIAVLMTDPGGQAYGGYDFWKLADYVGVPKSMLKFPAEVFDFTEYEVAGWLNCFDVLVNLSRGEGFGLTMLEAMACGTPVIASDFSSMTELVQGSGILIPPKALDVYTLKTQYLCIADYDAFGKKLAECIDKPDMVKSMGKRALKTAQKYDWDKIAPKWDIMLRKVDNTGFFPPYHMKEFK